MNQEKYIGMDVHDATICAAVMNAQGKLLTECVMETKASTILEFIEGQRGTLAVTFEEGILAAWLCCPGGERDAAQHGPSHPGTKDCCHHFNHVEERRE